MKNLIPFKNISELTNCNYRSLSRYKNSYFQILFSINISKNEVSCEYAIVHLFQDFNALNSSTNKLRKIKRHFEKRINVHQSFYVYCKLNSVWKIYPI